MSREYSLCAYSHWDQFLQGVSLQVFTTSGGTLHGLPHSFIVLALYSASCEYDLVRVYFKLPGIFYEEHSCFQYKAFIWAFSPPNADIRSSLVAYFKTIPIGTI